MPGFRIDVPKALAGLPEANDLESLRAKANFTELIVGYNYGEVIVEHLENDQVEDWLYGVAVSNALVQARQSERLIAAMTLGPEAVRG